MYLLQTGSMERPDETGCCWGKMLSDEEAIELGLLEPDKKGAE